MPAGSLMGRWDRDFNFCYSLVVSNVKPELGGRIVNRRIKYERFIHVTSSEPSAEVVKAVGFKKKNKAENGWT